MNEIHTAVEATSSALEPIIKQLRNNDPALDLSEGISLLLLRPQLLLSSLQQLIILTALRLNGVDVDQAEPTFPSLDQDGISGKDRASITKPAEAVNELQGELMLDNEIFDKIRGLESKLEYQIKKLVGLADTAARPAKDDEEVEEDPLSFKPNPSALVATRPEPRSSTSASAAASTAEPSSEVYRPPRMAAVHYEPDKQKRTRERRAPALLSEFASTLDGAPLVESTSGLSTRPVPRHSNSTSAKRAAELQRMDQFEEDNMTRLVTTKREAKRRREDEEALALGYGVGGAGRGRGRRQNGLEAELEGVLGDRGSKGVWDGVRAAKRGGLLDRAKGRSGTGDGEKKSKKARFERDVSRRK